jgi:hypothetical protein
MEEAVGGDRDGHEGAAPAYVDGAHVAPGVGVAPGCGAERAEVVAAAQEAQPRAHRLDVESAIDVPGVALQQRRPDPAVVDEIQVTLAPSGAPGVEARGGLDR